MTPDEFTRYGIRLYGRRHWRRDFALALGLDVSTVWRMSTRQIDIPVTIALAVKSLLEQHRIARSAARIAMQERARQKHRYRGKLTKSLRRRKDTADASPKPETDPSATDQADRG